MIRISVPGKNYLHIQHLLLDLNGTLSLDGKVLPGVQDRLNRLSETLDVFVVTCDTFGNAARIADDLHVGLIRTGEPGPGEAEEKANAARSLGSQVTAAIGNGESDALMLRESALGIAVLGTEGLSVKALLDADVVVPCIGDALDLLLEKKRLIATLRGGPLG
jgi:soluble P-type ATPase